MQDAPIISPRPLWLDQHTEDQAREILDLEDRVRDLQQHAEDVTHAAVAALRVAELRIARLKAERDRLLTENRVLRERVPSAGGENDKRRAA